MRSDFISLSDLTSEGMAHKSAVFGIATPWRRGKHCLISKKVGNKEENGLSDLKKNTDVRSQIGREDRLEPMIIDLPKHQRRAKPCPISKKVRKQGKKGMSDLKKIKDVRSQIERKSGLDTEIFGCHTSWRRGKLCPISKKSCGEKEKMGSAISENVKKMRPIVEKKI